MGPRPKPHRHENFAQWLEARATARPVPALAGLLRGAHDVGARSTRLTALTGYRRLAARAGHPVLTALLEHIQRDEARRFFFYYRRAELRLQRPAAARVSRFLVDRFWGRWAAGSSPRTSFASWPSYLFGDEEGRAAARKVDETIRKLPGFGSVRLLDAWLDRFHDGGRNGDR